MKVWGEGVPDRTNIKAKYIPGTSIMDTIIYVEQSGTLPFENDKFDTSCIITLFGLVELEEHR
jgi:hypothetical protein